MKHQHLAPLLKGMPGTLLCLSFFLICSIAGAQVDSLKNLLRTPLDDTSRIEMLNQLGMHLMYDYPDTSIQLGREALALCIKSNSERHLATTLAFLGTFFDLRGDFDSALVYYFKSMPIREKRNDKRGVAALLNNIGIVYMEQSNYPMALDYYARAMVIHSERNDKASIAECRNNMANVYLKLSDYPKALENYFAALQAYELLEDLPGQADVNANVGHIYKRQGNFEKALEYYSEALKIDEKQDNQYGLAIDYNNIGSVYGYQKEFRKALEYSSKSISIDRMIGNNMTLAVSYNNLGDLYFKIWSEGSDVFRAVGAWAERDPSRLLDSAFYYRRLAYDLNKSLRIREAMTYNLVGMGAVMVAKRRYPEAVSYFNESLALAKDVNARMREYDAYRGLSGAYEQWASETRDDRKRAQYLNLALANMSHYVDVKDSVLSEEKQQDIGRLEMRHEFEIAALRKQHEEQEQARLLAASVERRNNLQYSAILIGLCALFGAVYFLGRLSLPKWAVEFSVFVPFLILFEFMLVLFDPYGERWTGGAPGYKLLINAAMAGLIFPVHSFFERLLKKRLFGGRTGASVGP